MGVLSSLLQDLLDWGRYAHSAQLHVGFRLLAMVYAASVIYCGSFDAHIDEGMRSIQLLADLSIGVAWHTQAPQLGQVKTNYGIGK